MKNFQQQGRREILLFAALKDALGASVVMSSSEVEVDKVENIEMEPSEISSREVSAGDLKMELARRYPEQQLLIQNSLVAVDQEYVEDDFAIPAEAKEIALIPPVSGG